MTESAPIAASQPDSGLAAITALSKELLAQMARADAAESAIAAMTARAERAERIPREPTVAMLKAGNNANRFQGMGPHGIWCAMYDAAITSERPKDLFAAMRLPRVEMPSLCQNEQPRDTESASPQPGDAT